MERDVEYWYLGRICQALDDSNLHYHHCKTWFRLFPDDKENTYSIEGVKNNNNENEVVVYKGWAIDWCHNTNAPIVFQGSLEDFKSWLQNIK